MKFLKKLFNKPVEVRGGKDNKVNMILHKNN